MTRRWRARKREHGFRHGYGEKGDERHPDQIQDRDEHAEGFRAEPRQPTEQVLALLLWRKPAAAGQKSAPMLLDELHAAIGPAVALSLIGGEIAWQ